MYIATFEYATVYVWWQLAPAVDMQLAWYMCDNLEGKFGQLPQQLHG